MERLKRGWRRTPSSVRKPLVGFAGGLVIVGGLILVPLPGPGWAIVFIGLAILATEFAAAKRLKNTAEHHVKKAASGVWRQAKRLRKK